MVSGTRKVDHGLSQLLHSELHCLGILQRVQYKLGVTVHRCLQNKAPRCLMDWTHVHRTSQAANALDRPTVTSWWYHDTVAACLVLVGLSPLRVRWNGNRFNTHSGTLLGCSELSAPTDDRLVVWQVDAGQVGRQEVVLTTRWTVMGN